MQNREGGGGAGRARHNRAALVAARPASSVCSLAQRVPTCLCGESHKRSHSHSREALMAAVHEAVEQLQHPAQQAVGLAVELWQQRCKGVDSRSGRVHTPQHSSRRSVLTASGTL